MKIELPIRLVLIRPPAGVIYAIQRGRGSNYTAESAQQPESGDVAFEVPITVADKGGRPNFLGEYVQGPSGRRFIYVDVGKYAGQKDTPWARRMIVRLDDVTWPLINKATKPGKRLEGRIPGTAGDGGPNCATVSLIDGWKVVAD
jgi:hypothetical protein